MAVEQVKKPMDEAGGKTYAALKKAGKPTRYIGKKKLKEGQMGPKDRPGSYSESIVHNIQMAEVEVNTETGDVKVLKMTTAVDAGVIINPRPWKASSKAAWTRASVSR